MLPHTGLFLLLKVALQTRIRRRLNIESVQDTLSQESKQSGGGVRVQVSLGTAWEASGNFNQSKGSGESASVNQQSGLFAGDGGYHINADSFHILTIQKYQ